MLKSWVLKLRWKVKVEKIITKKITHLDEEYAEYQRLHRRFHLEDDEKAKIIYVHLIDAYKEILKEILRK